MIRSFVAIDLPDSTKEMLEQVSERLQDQVPHRTVRWSKISGIHLTLKFLGDVAQDDLPKIKSALSHVGQRHAPFVFTVGEVGCFPNLGRPRVVWVGIREETGALLSLQRDVEKSLKPLGFKPEGRAFHPHLTLGRTRRDAHSRDQRQLGEIIAGADIGKLDEVRVASFRLMRSDLRPDGAVYTSLAVFALGADQEAL